MDLKTAANRLLVATSRLSAVYRLETDGYGNVYAKFIGLRRAMLVARFPDWYEACKQLHKQGFERTGHNGQGFRGIWRKL